MIRPRKEAQLVVIYSCHDEQAAAMPISVFADNFGAKIAVSVSCPKCGGYHEFDVTKVGTSGIPADRERLASGGALLSEEGSVSTLNCVCTVCWYEWECDTDNLEQPCPSCGAGATDGDYSEPGDCSDAICPCGDPDCGPASR